MLWEARIAFDGLIRIRFPPTRAANMLLGTDMRGRAVRTIRQLLAGEDEIQLAVRLALLALLVYWTFVLIRPFVPILAWSVVLAVALYPVFSWLSGVLGGRPKLAADHPHLDQSRHRHRACDLARAWRRRRAAKLCIADRCGHLAFRRRPAAVKNWPVIGDALRLLGPGLDQFRARCCARSRPHLKPVAGTDAGFCRHAGLGTSNSSSRSPWPAPVSAGPRLVAGQGASCPGWSPERSEDFLGLAGATIRSVAQGVIGSCGRAGAAGRDRLEIAGVPSAGLLAFAVLMLGILQIGSPSSLLPVMIWIWIAKDLRHGAVVHRVLRPASASPTTC